MKTFADFCFATKVQNTTTGEVFDKERTSRDASGLYVREHGTNINLPKDWRDFEPVEWAHHVGNNVLQVTLESGGETFTAYGTKMWLVDATYHIENHEYVSEYPQGQFKLVSVRSRRRPAATFADFYGKANISAMLVRLKDDRRLDYFGEGCTIEGIDHVVFHGYDEDIALPLEVALKTVKVLKIAAYGRPLMGVTD